MARSLSMVINQLLDVIPSGESRKGDELRSHLNSTMRDLRYCPPEAIWRFWHSIMNVFDHAMPDRPNLNQWQQKAVDIWEGKNNGCDPHQTA